MTAMTVAVEFDGLSRWLGMCEELEAAAESAHSARAKGEGIGRRQVGGEGTLTGSRLSEHWKTRQALMLLALSGSSQVEGKNSLVKRRYAKSSRIGPPLSATVKGRPEGE